MTYNHFLCSLPKETCSSMKLQLRMCTEWRRKRDEQRKKSPLGRCLWLQQIESRQLLLHPCLGSPRERRRGMARRTAGRSTHGRRAEQRAAAREVATTAGEGAGNERTAARRTSGQRGQGADGRGGRWPRGEELRRTRTETRWGSCCCCCCCCYAAMTARTETEACRRHAGGRGRRCANGARAAADGDAGRGGRAEA